MRSTPAPESVTVHGDAGCVGDAAVVLPGRAEDAPVAESARTLSPCRQPSAAAESSASAAA